MTQLEFVKKQLLEYGSVSRNFCLKNYISRLGSRINDLTHGGWVIEGKWVKTDHGRDYVYYLVNSPFKKVVYKVNNEVVASAYEKK